ncbi:MAG: response regulator transcription factor [Dehalococcoidales bacterium]|nr:response regulator transcription factor [Dehalococcoidales bacterium]
MSKIKVFLIDDHDIIRTGIRKMLELEPGFEVVGEACDADEAFACMDKLMVLGPSVILMDIKMPGMDGIELTRQLKRKLPECKILIFTLHSDYLSQAFKAGASGYLLKDIRRSELTRLIRQALKGDTVLSKNLGPAAF